LIDMGVNLPGNNNLRFTYNIIATDIMWHSRVLYADYSAQFTGTTNVWRRNKLQLYPGSGSTYASA
jgi:hypothetical protein